MFQILPFYFILSAFIGFLILYLFSPKPEIILKNPNINNQISDMYIDDNNVCYKYKREEVNCPM